MADVPAGWRDSRRLVAGWLAVATLLGWSVFDHLPHPGLDRSWEHGLSLMHIDGVRFGDEVAFNYGPMGFIARPIAGTGVWFPLAVAVLLALTVLAAWLVYSSLIELGLSAMVAGPATAGVMLVAPFENLFVETFTVIGVAWLLLRRRREDAISSTTIASCAAMVALVGLIKVSVFIPAAVSVAAVAVSCGGRAIRASVIAFTASFLGLWVLSGQRLGDVPMWANGARHIAQGHVSAMSLDDPARRWEYAAVAVLVVIGVALVIDRTSAMRIVVQRRAPALVAVGVALVVGWFVVRQGFTRHGARTRLVFFSLAWLLAVLAPWRRLPAWRRQGVAAVLACTAISFVLAAGSLERLVNPVTPIGDAAESARLVASPSYRTSQVEQAKFEARSFYDVPSTMLGRIGNEPVLVDPYEIGAAWAYDLRWAPFASMQRYLGYTEWLDGRNQEVLTGPSRPAFVLRENNATIDGRYSAAESPRFVTELFCSYEVVESSGRWDLLEASSNRCGVPELIAELDVGANETVSVPAGGQDAVLMAVTFDGSAFNSLAGLVLKPLTVPHLWLDDRRFRMLPATSSTPALIAVPGAAADDAGFGLVDGVETIRLESAATVSVYSMQLDE